MRNRQRVVITIASVAVLFVISTVYSNFDVLEAFAGETLSSDNVAKNILVRVTNVETLDERAYDSFSRVGFVSGEGNFLLESVPSKDKKPFYELLKRSIEDRTRSDSNNKMHVAIDLYSGDGELIQSLEYNECHVKEYFVYGVDSRGKIFFSENSGEVEIREVTKFECVSFSLNLDPFKVIQVIEKTLAQIEADELEESERSEFEKFQLGGDPFFSSAPGNSAEGDLFYNSDTNTLQKYENGTWVDISGVGGPPSPRR